MTWNAWLIVYRIDREERELIAAGASLEKCWANADRVCKCGRPAYCRLLFEGGDREGSPSLEIKLGPDGPYEYSFRDEDVLMWSDCEFLRSMGCLI